ncbi:MAG: metallophosphatase family protein [Bacteroidota bacterium]|nr:metallophosphatase family protein [Bacteroidota bacterium]
MKKIGILSDTHGHLDDRILHHLQGCDEIWHIGDWGTIAVSDSIVKLGKKVRGVFGNIDGRELRLSYPEKLTFNCEGVKVSMVHIGGYPGRYSPGIRQLILEKKPGIFLSGHSHILKVMRDKNLDLLHINPGAAGHYGFHKIRTLILMEIDEGRPKNMQVVELGKRATGAIDPAEGL